MSEATHEMGRRAFLAAMTAAAGSALLPRPAGAQVRIVPIPNQYIAALGDPAATEGEDAATWGLWPVDPGPRGVPVYKYPELAAADGVAPAGWRHDGAAWWLEENGLLMEPPVFPLPAGQYVVTGAREVTSILTVGEPDGDGNQPWSLANGATIHDVTHLKCRAALYTPAADGASCQPDRTPVQVFPMRPGISMPEVEGCAKRDYHVLIVIGMVVTG